MTNILTHTDTIPAMHVKVRHMMNRRRDSLKRICLHSCISRNVFPPMCIHRAKAFVHCLTYIWLSKLINKLFV